MNYYKKDGSYIASDLVLDLETVTEEEYNEFVKKEEKISKIKSQLKELDEKSARSLRAIVSGVATEDDRNFLSGIETQAEELRQELKDLIGA